MLRRGGSADGPAGGTPARVHQWAVLAAVAVAAVAADQATKALVRAELVLGESVDGAGPFSIQHVRNSGIVHGLFPGTASYLAAITAVVLAGVLVYFARHGAERRSFPVAFGLLVGGSVGNLADRIRLGYVTDFVRRDGGGAFNAADVSITLAVLVLAAAALGGLRRPAPARQADSA